ncbi:KTSC domain-containing protein [Calidifontibacter indicus]|uniref:KTSC domain-containing protein n=1 Tax=Calidifontibacter indicus TaxID=419650 RepID=UPI003D73AB74
MLPTTSTNVSAVGYEPATRIMRVQLRSGSVFDYYGVGPHRFEQMLLPSPWAATRTTRQDTPTRQSGLTSPNTQEGLHVPLPDSVGPHP